MECERLRKGGHQTVEQRQRNHEIQTDWWIKNKDSESAKRRLAALRPRQNSFWKNKEEAAKINKQRKIQHDEGLDKRIEELKRLGARILATDYALKTRRREIPDVLYYLN